MAALQITYVLFLILSVKRAKASTIRDKMPIVEKPYDIKAHLENPNVTLACRTRDSICRSNDTSLCAVRFTNGTKVYKDYTNSCFLFMSNMCDNPGEEFYILSGGTCSNYLASRRQEDTDKNVATEIDDSFTETTIDTAVESVSENAESDTTVDPIAKKYTESPILRKKTVKTLSTLYSIKRAHDGHRCPRSCPNIYSPECINVNEGKHFKFFQFVNHCSGDMFYCLHPRDFDPPHPEMEEPSPSLIKRSALAWRHCAHAKYIQLSYAADSMNLLGYYGWLKGNFGARHILEPHERMPGYG